MNSLDYDYLRKLLKERSGLVLSSDKQYLMESRLLPIMRRLGLANLAALVAKLRGAGAGVEALIGEVVEAMTTNETFFYRDRTPFDNFSQAIGSWRAPTNAVCESGVRPPLRARNLIRWRYA